MRLLKYSLFIVLVLLDQSVGAAVSPFPRSRDAQIRVALDRFVLPEAPGLSDIEALTALKLTGATELAVLYRKIATYLADPRLADGRAARRLWLLARAKVDVDVRDDLGAAATAQLKQDAAQLLAHFTDPAARAKIVERMTDLDLWTDASAWYVSERVDAIDEGEDFELVDAALSSFGPAARARVVADLRASQAPRKAVLTLIHRAGAATDDEVLEILAHAAHEYARVMSGQGPDHEFLDVAEQLFGGVITTIQNHYLTRDPGTVALVARAWRDAETDAARRFFTALASPEFDWLEVDGWIEPATPISLPRPRLTLVTPDCEQLFE